MNMTRIEKSKEKLEVGMKTVGEGEKLALIFQELINQLPTYKEQRELYAFYKTLKTKKDLVLK